MGKLRFTLTYLVFWLIIIFSCLLAENFAILSSDHMGGMSVDSLILLALFIIFMLIFYYYKEHKNNELTFDKILLPIIGVFGFISIMTIWWQSARTFVNPDDGFSTVADFTIKEKFSYTLQIIVWCAVLYGILFVANRYSISRKWLKWLALVYVFGILVCSLVDVVMEFNSIISIFVSTYEGPGLQFIIYNANVWGHMLLVALLSCLILNIKKFNLFFYILMIHFFIMIIFTTCATAVFVGLAAIFSYTLFEIFSIYRNSRQKSFKLLIIYVSSLVAFFGFFAIMVAVNVPIFTNFWSYISRQILQKDYSTLTSRTGIWASIIKLLSSNPRDFIFGLGYKTGNIIFTQYFLAFNSHEFAIRSAHNGILEIFLRHGILGLLTYLGIFVVYAFGIIRLFNKKQYRVAFFSLICVVGLLAHGIAESTMFLTPNIGGTYGTLIFLLPVINATKDKYFDELNNDLQNSRKEEVKITINDLCYFINSLAIGLLIALLLTLTIGYMYSNLPALIAYIVIAVVTLASLFITPLIVSLINKTPYAGELKRLLLLPLKDNCFVIVAIAVIGVTLSFGLQQVFTYDLFSLLLFTIFWFIAYNFAIALKCDNKLLALTYFDQQFSIPLRNVSSEVSYE